PPEPHPTDAAEAPRQAAYPGTAQTHKRPAAQKRIAPRPFSLGNPIASEVILYRQLDDAMPQLAGGRAEERVGLFPVRVEHQIEVLVGAKRVVRVIDEIEPFHTELQTLRFLETEVLEQRDIGVDKLRPKRFGFDDGAVVTRRRQRETVRVQV